METGAAGTSSVSRFRPFAFSRFVMRTKPNPTADSDESFAALGAFAVRSFPTWECGLKRIFHREDAKGVKGDFEREVESDDWMQKAG